jgi:hypothetical protein
MMMFLLSFFLLNTGFAAPNDKILISAISKCFPATNLRNRLNDEASERSKLKRPDIRLRINSGYTSNEISSNNPERLQLGANIRWDDITDQRMRAELVDTQTSYLSGETKLMLEAYWRKKLDDFYFWKWGRSTRNIIEKFRNYSLNKIKTGAGAITDLATTKNFTDLLELNKLSSEYLARIDAIQSEIDTCKELNLWKENLDFDEKQIQAYSKKASNKLVYHSSKCNAQKKSKSIYHKRENGTWSLAFVSSINRNRQLSNGDDQFNDVRMGMELVVPISGMETPSVSVDKCDYEEKQILNEDIVERNLAISMYPLISSLKDQFKAIQKKIKLISFDTNKYPTRELVAVGITFLNSHKSLSYSESKINSRVISSRIVENEL